MVTNERIEELRRGQEAILARLSELREEFNQRLDEMTDLFRQQIVEAPEEVGLGDEIPAMAKNPGAFNFEDPNTSINKRPPSPLEAVPSPLEAVPGKKQCISESEAICAKNPQLPAAVPIKFGMIKETLLVEGFVFDFQIYMVDVVAGGGVIVDEYQPIEPTAQFQFRPKGSLPAICGVKSTVYVFEGSKNFLRYPHSAVAPTPEEKSAYKFVFSSGDDELLRDIPPMNQFKSDPIALPTPDGEIFLVFSGRFVLKDSGAAFELLDTNDDSWTQLPPLPCIDSCTKSAAEHCCHCNSNSIAEANAYSFIGDSQFLLQIQRGVFVLDLNKRKWATLNKSKWATFGAKEVVPDDHQGYFETVKGRYVLIPRRKPPRYDGDDDDYDDIGLAAVWAYDFGEDVFLSKDARFHEFRRENEHWCELSIFPRPHYPDYQRWRARSFFSILRSIEQEDGACTSRVVQIDVVEKINSKELWHKARILVNVCRTDLATIETSVSNSVGLIFDLSGDTAEVTFFNI
ncbi:hypothetical protein ACS0TY_019374 [Phlomoides rotata]